MVVGFFFGEIIGSGDLKIIVNGKEEIIEQDATIAGLIAQKSLNPTNIIVEYNYDLIKKENWEEIVLKEDDQLEILKFVGGG
jgi:sulfur carrier protein